MVIFLYGEDTYRSRERLTQLTTRFKKERDPEGLNVSFVDASSTKENILETIKASPFLAEKRMVVVERLAQTKQKEVQTEITELITKDAFPKTSVVIFWEEKSPDKHKEAKQLWDTLKATPYAQEFSQMNAPEANSWIQAYIKEHGKTIENDALFLLSPLAVKNTWEAKQLLDTVIGYIGTETTVTKKEVALFLEEGSEDVIFALVDATLAGQTKQAYELLSTSRRHGQEAGYVIAMIIRQVRIMLQVEDMLRAQPGVPTDQVARTLAIHPFVAKKTISLTKHLAPHTAERMHSMLLQGDMAIKTGRQSPDEVLEFFIAQTSL